jgi:hypothetical protein
MAYSLSDDERAWLDQQIAAVRLRSNDQASVGADLLIGEIHRRRAAGDQTATSALLWLAREGARQEIGSTVRNEKRSYKNARTDTVTRMPSAFAVERIVDGRRVVQHKLWFEAMSLDELISVRDGLQRTLTQYGAEVSQLDDVIRIYEQYPDAANAAEAYRLAGLEPPEIAGRELLG